MRHSLYRGEAVLLLVLLCAFVFLGPTTGTADELTVSAALSPVSFSVNESGQLLVTVNGTKNAELELPEVQGLDILHRGQSSRINIINGSYSASVTTTFALIASAPGDYTIPPIKVITGNKELETEPLELTVTRPGATAAAPGRVEKRDEDRELPRAFLTLHNLDREHYLGEVVPVTIKAYFPQGLRADLASLPKLVGDSWVIEPLSNTPRQIQETVDGAPYSVLVWETNLSPIKEGDSGLQLELEAVQYLQRRRQSTSLFDSPSPFGRDFFDDFFGGVEKRPFKLTSERLQAAVLPLPAEGRPDSFHGAVGRFTFETTVEPDTAEVGEPLTLRMRIGGEGNLDRIDPPDFPNTPEWKSYAPAAVQEDTSGRQRREKLFEQAIVAKDPGVHTVPALTFSYFDPATKSYLTLTSSPLPVTITGGGQPQPTAPSPAAAVPETTGESGESWEGMAPLHLEEGQSVETLQPLHRQNRYLILLGAVLLTLTGSAAFRIYQHTVRNRREQKDQVRLKQVRRSLQAMEAAAAGGDSARFLAEARHCLQQYFGSLWGCEPAAITLGDIVARLGTSAPLTELFRATEQAAYGGMVLDQTAMAEAVRTIRSELGKTV